MNESRRSKTKCRRQQEEWKVNNTDEVVVTKSMKVEVEKGDSPQHSCDAWVSGHSTPIQKRDYSFNVEDSPELDYRCSPILLPCTQDGGNEIAWDWQTSTGKTSNEKSTTHVETPKRTKLLQKKRNSNSPLLQKPLKRKQVKMENIESIGKLAAELQALTERMRTIKQNGENHPVKKENDIIPETRNRFLINLNAEDKKDVMLEVVVNEDKPNIQTVTIDNNNKKGSSYEELFDDSIDASMVKCSQEIEEKFNLGKTNGIDIADLTVEKKEEMSVNTQYSAIHNSTKSSKNLSSSKNSSKMNVSNHVKTYSKNSSILNSTSSIQISNLNSTSKSDSHKSSFNNNAINTQNERNKLKEGNKSDFFEIPDDSFDDCLATCMEDDKVLSKLSEYDFICSGEEKNLNHGKRSKQNKSTVDSKRTSNTFIQKLTSPSYSNNHNDSKTGSPNTSRSMENRKFFKSKSLSDQCFGHDRKTTTSECISTSNKVSSKSNLPSNQLIHGNSVKLYVSTTFPVVKSQTSGEDSNFSTINKAATAHVSNSPAEKDGGTRIVKYKSTSNLCSNPKDTIRQSQPIKCTPEEIERKRLEAKIRLQAKRKLQQNAQTTNTPSEIPVKRPVKR